MSRPDRGPRRGDRRAAPAQRPSRPQETDAPRRAALDLLAAVRERDAYANLVLPELLRSRRVTGRDAALATELGYGTCRAVGLLDAVLTECVDRPLAQVDGDVLDALRLGAYQLLRTRVPSHAAVAATVELVRGARGRGTAGFVNAVLRKVDGRDEAAWVAALAPDRATDPIGHLAFATAHPRWIAEAFHQALTAGEPGSPGAADHMGAGNPDTDDRNGGHALSEPRTRTTGTADTDDSNRGHGRPEPRTRATETADTDDRNRGHALSKPRTRAGGDGFGELEAALLADDERPGVHLAARPGVITADELAAVTGGEPAPYSPYGVHLDGGNPADLDVLSDGTAAVQDEGSQLVALALAAAPLDGPDGGRWLDLCAGPGGKAALLGALVDLDGGTLDAVERAEHRARLVERACVDLPVTVHHVDGRASGLPAGGFDRVLVDVPCTGLGALRRRPEARWRRTPDSLTELVPLQRALLDAALRLVRPGGVVAYVTCSPHLAETVDVVSGPAATAGVEAIDAVPLLHGLANRELPHLGDGPYVQLWPHRHGTDALFCALLRRTTD